MLINLRVPFSEKDKAKSLGARWDYEKRTWFIYNVEDLTPFIQWIDKTGKYNPEPKYKKKYKGVSERHWKITGPKVFKPLCNCDVLPWNDCEHTKHPTYNIFDGGGVKMIEKQHNYRDPDLLKLAQGEKCLLNIHPLCLWDEGSTTVAAHSNLMAHGKGKSMKAGDCYTVWACQKCHFDLDQGVSMTQKDKEKSFDKAWHEQVKQWQQIAQEPTRRPWKVQAASRVLAHLDKVPFLEG